MLFLNPKLLPLVVHGLSKSFYRALLSLNAVCTLVCIKLASTKFNDFVYILAKLAHAKFSDFMNLLIHITIHFAGLASTKFRGKTKITKTAKFT